MDLASIVRSKADFLIGMRRRIHAHPELSGREFETAALVREELTKAGIEWRPCGLQTGTLAEIRGAKPGRTVLLRADMDALPVTETTGASFASCNPGVMHACGHNCHTAMLLTAALVLQETREEWGGVVRLAFQPAEESGEGALSMIAQGALEGVYACFAMHVWSDVPAGRIGLISGPCMAGTDRFEIDVKGVGGHARAARALRGRAGGGRRDRRRTADPRESRGFARRHGCRDDRHVQFRHPLERDCGRGQTHGYRQDAEA